MQTILHHDCWWRVATEALISPLIVMFRLVPWEIRILCFSRSFSEHTFMPVGYNILWAICPRSSLFLVFQRARDAVIKLIISLTCGVGTAIKTVFLTNQEIHFYQVLCAFLHWSWNCHSWLQLIGNEYPLMQIFKEVFQLFFLPLPLCLLCF